MPVFWISLGTRVSSASWLGISADLSGQTRQSFRYLDAWGIRQLALTHGYSAVYSLAWNSAQTSKKQNPPGI